MTYNVHRCLGSDGTTSPSRIAEVLASCEPDIVALQELDVNRARSGGVDQAEAIARELGMHMHFHPAFEVLDERYGDALLTARPVTLLRAERLPGSGHATLASISHSMDRTAGRAADIYAVDTLHNSRCDDTNVQLCLD